MTIPQCTFASPSPQEEWRAVVGYEGLYEVSSHGRVRRVASGQGARAGRVLALSLTTRGDLTLVCHCAPLACHADVIARHLREALETSS